MTSTRSMLTAFFNQDNSTAPTRPTTPSPPTSPSPTSINQNSDCAPVNDPQGLLERSRISAAALSWQARESALGKGKLVDLCKHKSEQRKKAEMANNYLIQKQQADKEKLEALLAKKNSPRLFSQSPPITSSSSPQDPDAPKLVVPKPVKALGRIKIQF